jgi:hypothetical protein
MFSVLHLKLGHYSNAVGMCDAYPPASNWTMQRFHKKRATLHKKVRIFVVIWPRDSAFIASIRQTIQEKREDVSIILKGAC